MTRARRRPVCSQPRAGSDSAHTAVPLQRPPVIPRVARGDVSSPGLVPVGHARPTDRASECLYPLTPLVSIEQPLDKARSTQPLLSRVLADTVVKLRGDLDYCNRQKTLAIGIPFWVPRFGHPRFRWKPSPSEISPFRPKSLLPDRVSPHRIKPPPRRFRTGAAVPTHRKADAPADATARRRSITQNPHAYGF